MLGKLVALSGSGAGRAVSVQFTLHNVQGGTQMMKDSLVDCLMDDAVCGCRTKGPEKKGEKNGCHKKATALARKSGFSNIADPSSHRHYAGFMHTMLPAVNACAQNFSGHSSGTLLVASALPRRSGPTPPR